MALTLNTDVVICEYTSWCHHHRAYHSVPWNMVFYLIMSPYSSGHNVIYSHHEELLLIQVEFRPGCQVNSLGKLGVGRISPKLQGSPHRGVNNDYRNFLFGALGFINLKFL